jgi:peptide-methionine (S)-S-oxide reductase
VGYQYRSVIFTHSEEQAEIARRVLERAQERFGDPIMTAIEPAQPFWRAEDYHQCYLQKRSSSGLMGMLLGRSS